MSKNEIYQLLTNNPVFQLATAEGDQPRVRGMLLYRADEKGIVFHTSNEKPLHAQIKQNPKVELCFFDMQKNAQVRISGVLEIIADNALKDEIYNHPTRAFLKGWRAAITDEEFYKGLIVFNLRHGKAALWTMETNFNNHSEIELD